MKKVVFFVVSLLAGCASSTGPVTINPANVDSSQLANIVTFQPKSPSFPGAVQIEYGASIAQVYDEKHKPLLQSGFSSRAASEVNLPPGKYTIAGVCSNFHGFASPTLVVELEPSKKYMLRCSIFMDRNLLGIKMDSRAELILDDIEKKKNEMPHWP